MKPLTSPPFSNFYFIGCPLGLTYFANAVSALFDHCPSSKVLLDLFFGLCTLLQSQSNIHRFWPDQDEWIAPSVVLLSLVSKEGKILQVCACVLCRKMRKKKRTASRARSRGYPCTEIRRKKGNFSSWRGKARERESVGQGQDKASQWGGRPFILYQTLGLLPLKLLQSFKLSPGAEREKGKS